MNLNLWRLKTSWFLLLLVLASGCTPQISPPTSRPVVNVGLILGTGGLGDRSFNDSAYAGLQEAQKRYGIRFESINFTSDKTNMAELQRMIRLGYDMIIGIGFENAKYIQALSNEHPDRKFAIVDTTVAGDNVASVICREQEGDFLLGVLAAMLTKTKRVGFIGGVDIDVIRRIESGFKQGIIYQDNSVEVVTDIAGTFADPEVGKTLALKQYQTGVDVIYNAAGRTGLGIIEAAKETGQFTLGTSGDQRYLAPGNVVGNRPKRVDTAVLMLVEEMIQGKFTPGVRSLGLKEGGLELGPFDQNLVTGAMMKRLDELKEKIISGEISF
jgi:basic membrane protein A